MLASDDWLLMAALAHEAVLRKVLYGYTRNVADVDELLQETYARLLVAGARMQPRDVGSVRAFAITIARNSALDWVRHRTLVPIALLGDFELFEPEDERASPERQVSAKQDLSFAIACAQRLPRKCRRVFVLRQIYGYGEQEVARRLGISPNTVQQHMQKAKRLFANYWHASREGAATAPLLKLRDDDAQEGEETPS